jgi:hypothetical protein
MTALNYKNLVQTTLECSECGNKRTIPRRKSKRKNVGHIKHVGCFSEQCNGKETAHREIGSEN